MKIRLLVNGNGKYIIETKNGFFSKWEHHNSFNSLEAAQSSLKMLCRYKKEDLEYEKGKKKITLIEQHNFKDI